MKTGRNGRRYGYCQNEYGWRDFPVHILFKFFYDLCFYLTGLSGLHQNKLKSMLKVRIFRAICCELMCLLW